MKFSSRSRINNSRFGLLILALVTVAQAAEPDPNRLDQIVVPLAQAIELTLNPAEETYHGRVRIEVRVNEQTRRFRLHAKEMTLRQAELIRPGKRMAVNVTVTDARIGIVTVEAPAPIEPGLYTLEVSFENDFERTGTAIYKTVFRNEPYLFTQLEDVHARRAFPCWDDPEFKIPWQLTVTSPGNLSVVTNTPVVYSDPAGANTTWRFGRTRPMPSYLLAIAVGPLEFVAVPGLQIPGRIVTARGQAGLAGEIAAMSPALLATLERYFGVPYPYEKLDQLALPEFVFGGMENAGAIMYRDSAILFPANNLSLNQKKRLAEIVAHEMAHMWFGDLVTMRWWTDLWLNESFATWISHKIVGEAFPELGAEVERIRSVHEAMMLDSQTVVEPIRREMRAGGDTVSLVDALTYNKGQAVLDMTEAWIGTDMFRRSMQSYFLRHAWGSTDAADLWRALDESSGQNISGIVTPFITQPGIPFLEFEIGTNDRVKVSQSRFHPLTGAASTATWPVPVFLRYASDGQVRQHRFLLRDRSADVVIPGITKAEWIGVNDGARGYYRWSLPAAWLARLTRAAPARLGVSERLNLIANAKALFIAGKVNGGVTVEAIATFVGDADPEVAQEAVQELGEALRIFIHPGNRGAVAAALQRVLNPVAKRIGWAAQPGEPATVASLRSALLVLLGEMADDPGAIEAARDVARRVFAGERLDPELRIAGLHVSAAHGDRALVDALLRRIASDLTPTERRETMVALGSFRQPGLVDLALAFALSDQVKSTEIRSIPLELARTEENRSRVVEWVMQHYDELVKRVPELHFGGLITIADGNDPDLAKRFYDFLLDPARVKPAAIKQARLVSERVAVRAALRTREQAAVEAALVGLGAPQVDAKR